MSRPTATLPRIVHGLPGRIRVHVPGLTVGRRGDVEEAVAPLRLIRGVRRVSANAATGNVLVHFDPGSVSEARLLSALSLPPEPAAVGVTRRAALAGVLPITAAPAAPAMRAAPAAPIGSRRRVAASPTRAPSRASGLAHAAPLRGGAHRARPPRVDTPARTSRFVVAPPPPSFSSSSRGDRGRQRASLGALLRSALTVVPRIPIVRGWLVGILGPVPVSLFPFVPAALALVSALLSASGPVEWTTAGLDAFQFATEIGGALRAA